MKFKPCCDLQCVLGRCINNGLSFASGGLIRYFGNKQQAQEYFDKSSPEEKKQYDDFINREAPKILKKLKKKLQKCMVKE